MDESERTPGGRETWHLTPAEVWESQSSALEYLPEGFAAEGFIHCTDDQERLIEAGNRYYRPDFRTWLALLIDLDAVTSPWRYDDPEQVYPHIYGPLNRSAVLSVRSVTRHVDGAFVGLAD